MGLSCDKEERHEGPPFAGPGIVPALLTKAAVIHASNGTVGTKPRTPWT